MFVCEVVKNGKLLLNLYTIKDRKLFHLLIVSLKVLPVGKIKEKLFFIFK